MKLKIQAPDGYKIVNLNRRKEIRERCFNCSGWSYKEVENCIFQDCSLFPFRLGKGKQDAKARAKAIRDYCLWCSYLSAEHSEDYTYPDLELSYQETDLPL